ncbi:alpha/beta hydrolase [Streptomyces sp. ODS28]|uniref:alpha/beta hydrolase n=1 Tax=Streptomyces sp. ODS28 TaxID=3136688 RepID=UPI0031EB2C52
MRRYTHTEGLAAGKGKRRLRGLTRATVVGGLAAALAVTGLTGFTAAAGTTRPAASRTETARAADTYSPALRSFVHQRPHWQSCRHKELDKAGARCASIRVPLDYRHPQGRTLRISFSRIKATDTAHRIGLLMHNSGGPGGPTLDMPLMDAPAMGKKLAARYDLIGMDPRGVGRSEALHCGTNGHWLRSAGYDAAGFRAHARFVRGLVRSCQGKYGEGKAGRYGQKMPYLRHFTTRNTARDMDLLRAVLGERRTSYFGVSYGTYLGAVYAKMFPRRVDRLLLDSALDPALWQTEAFRRPAAANEKFLDDWAAWAARRNGTYGLGGSAKEVRATVEGIARQAAREPLKVGRFTADGQQVPFVLVSLMTDDRAYAETAKNVRLLHRAAQGRTVEPTPELAEALGPPDGPVDTQTSLQLALLCGDNGAPRDLSWYRGNVERSRARAPLFGPVFNGTNPCAFWPDEPLERPVLTGNGVPGLIVQATGDTRTPYASGLALHRAMPRSRMITLRASVHGVYGMYPNRCVYAQVNAYLSTGRLPERDTLCAKDPRRK